MGSNTSQCRETPSKTSHRVPFYTNSMQHQSRVVFPSISDVETVPHPKDWLTVLACSNCGYLVYDEYNLCNKGGHLTCRDCWKDFQNLVCQYPVPVVGTKPSTSKANCEKLETVPCGGLLTDLPNVFVDNLLENVEYFCPYRREGCKETLPGKEMRIHYTLRCPFNKYNRVSEDQPASSPDKRTSKSRFAKFR